MAEQRWGHMCMFAGSKWDNCKAQHKRFRKAPASLSEAVTAQWKRERVAAESWCPNIATMGRHTEQMGLICPAKT